MTRHLVLVHGRAQQGKDAGALKAEWLEALQAGLARSGLTLPIPEDRVHFPFYGDSLAQMDQGKSPEEAARVILRGGGAEASEVAFAREIVAQLRVQAGITEAQLAAVIGAEAIERGPLNWGWVQAVLGLIDRHVPFGSGASIALFTHDVYSYLHKSAIREQIDLGIAGAVPADAESVVVAHSLGTVVAYHVLRTRGDVLEWRVPAFITLGSPLAVTEIYRTLKRMIPMRRPACVGHWFNALDERDVVALYPLDPTRFPLHPPVPGIDNKRDVQNRTENRHGIVGYLEDPEVARRIHDALVS